MRCYICNSILSAEEVQWNKEHEDWNPCRKCEIEIEEVFEPLSEEEIEHGLQREEQIEFDEEESQVNIQT